jgi:hypothetical protein
MSHSSSSAHATVRFFIDGEFALFGGKTHFRTAALVFGLEVLAFAMPLRDFASTVEVASFRIASDCFAKIAGQSEKVDALKALIGGQLPICCSGMSDNELVALIKSTWSKFTQRLANKPKVDAALDSLDEADFPVLRSLLKMAAAQTIENFESEVEALEAKLGESFFGHKVRRVDAKEVQEIMKMFEKIELVFHGGFKRAGCDLPKDAEAFCNTFGVDESKIVVLETSKLIGQLLKKKVIKAGKSDADIPGNPRERKLERLLQWVRASSDNESSSLALALLADKAAHTAEWDAVAHKALHLALVAAQESDCVLCFVFFLSCFCVSFFGECELFFLYLCFVAFKPSI